MKIDIRHRCLKQLRHHLLRHPQRFILQAESSYTSPSGEV